MLLEQFLLRELIPSWEHLNDKNSWCSDASRSQSPKWITCITACYPVSEALCFTSNPECRWAGRGSGKHCLNLIVKSSTKGVGEGRYVWQHTQGSLAVRASQEQTKKNSWSSGEQRYGCIYETCTRVGALTGKAISSAQLCKHHRCTVQHNAAWQLLFPLLIAHSPRVWMYPWNNTRATTGTKNPHPSCRILAQNSPQALKSPCLLPPPLARSRKLQTGCWGQFQVTVFKKTQLLKSMLSLHKSNRWRWETHVLSALAFRLLWTSEGANDMKVKI